LATGEARVGWNGWTVCGLSIRDTADCQLALWGNAKGWHQKAMGWEGKDSLSSADAGRCRRIGKKKAFQFLSFSRKNGAATSFVSRPDA